MYTIEANVKGSRTIAVSGENLQTIRKYRLLSGVEESHGVIDDEVLERVKLYIRSLICRNEAGDPALLRLCVEVFYHDNMKACALKNLLHLYADWEAAHPEDGGQATSEAE